MPDRDLLDAVREALVEPCGCVDLGAGSSENPPMVRLRDCPTCLPVRIVTAFDLCDGVNNPDTSDMLAALTGDTP
jgi:hypothetical protein